MASSLPSCRLKSEVTSTMAASIKTCIRRTSRLSMMPIKSIMLDGSARMTKSINRFIGLNADFNHRIFAAFTLAAD